MTTFCLFQSSVFEKFPADEETMVLPLTLFLPTTPTSPRAKLTLAHLNHYLKLLTKPPKVPTLDRDHLARYSCCSQGHTLDLTDGLAVFLTKQARTRAHLDHQKAAEQKYRLR